MWTEILERVYSPFFTKTKLYILSHFLSASLVATNYLEATPGMILQSGLHLHRSATST